MNLSHFNLHTLNFAAGAALYAQMEESAKLAEVIRENLKGLGYGQ